MSELCINGRRAGDLAAATTTRLKRQSRQPVLPKMSAIDPNMAATSAYFRQFTQSCEAVAARATAQLIGSLELENTA